MFQIRLTSSILVLTLLPAALQAAPRDGSARSAPAVREAAPRDDSADARPRRRARAEPSASAARTDDTEKALGKRYYKKGQRLFERGDYREAIAALEKALKHWRRREIHFNIAACHYKLGQRHRAATHLLAYLRGAADRRRERRRLPRPLRRLLRRVGVVIVSVSRDDVDIWINGRPRGRRRVEVAVRPGEVAVELKRKDRSLAHKVLRVGRGSVARWEIDDLQKLAGGSGGGAGNGGGGAAGGGSGNGAGGGSGSWVRQRLHWAWFTASAALAVAAAGSAVGLGLKTRDLHQRFDREPSFELRDEGLRYQHATNAMWAVAGAAAISAAVLAIFTRWGREVGPAAPRPRTVGPAPTEVTLVPGVGPAGVSLTGTW
jgi:tetratricopeptide (TPR) repeat protein